METKDVIHELRNKAGLSQDELAEKLFVTRQAVSRWENGETVPNTETLKLLSKLFRVSINTLLGSPQLRLLPPSRKRTRNPLNPPRTIRRSRTASLPQLRPLPPSQKRARSLPNLSRRMRSKSRWDRKRPLHRLPALRTARKVLP